MQTALRDNSRTSAGVGAIWGRGNNLRRSLVIAEIALCAVLLIGAGLLIRSFARVRDVNPGFDPRNVLTLELTLTGERYKDKHPRLIEAVNTLAQAELAHGHVHGAGGHHHH